MSAESDYIAINRQSWNNRVTSHLSSDFYDVEGFLKGKTSLNNIELNILGDITGKSILHLQCHFGQDTISLERMGATVTGVDLSDKAIESANELAKKANSKANFICCDIYDLPQHLDAQFDRVYTTYGTIGWLPDLDRWAALIARYLKPGGQLVFVEFHPVVWMFDNDFETITYNYFKADAIIESESGTYADREAPIRVDSVTWNHSMSEVVNSLIKHGLTITTLNEYDYSPYNCFKGTVEFEPHKFRIESMGNKLPMVYAVVASASSA